MTPLPYKVFTRAVGQRREMVAGFATRSDAVKWAIEISQFRLVYSDKTVQVHNSDGRIFAKFRSGVEV